MAWGAETKFILWPKPTGLPYILVRKKAANALCFVIISSNLRTFLQIFNLTFTSTDDSCIIEYQQLWLDVCHAENMQELNDESESQQTNVLEQSMNEYMTKWVKSTVKCNQTKLTTCLY